MKTIKFFLCGLLSVCATLVCAVNVDSLALNQLQQMNLRIDSLSNVQSKNQKQNAVALQALQRNCEQLQMQLQALSAATDANAANIQTTAEKLGVDISNTNSQLRAKADNSNLKMVTIFGCVVFLLLVALCVVLYVLIHKRSVDIESLRQKAEELNEKIVGNFSSEIAEIRKMSSSISASTQANTTSDGQPDHTIVKVIADRIAFMETTLSRMDSSVRGYKQLSKAIAQMKDNLNANGYELVDMLGKSYNDGMKVIANFTEDENLEKGQQIITAIIKPQINYKGTMIQAAQITVSQNL
jgi:hypothetical protein